MTAARVASVALVAAALSACDQGAPATSPMPTPPAPAERPGADAATRYAEMCASCHGESGEGGFGPSLVDTRRTVDELTRAIDGRMPVGNPGACRTDCARSLAAYIKASFTSAALACDAVPPSPRRLRLLTRREYRATVRDLFGLARETPAPAPAADCTRRRFAYAPGGRALRSVHLAGSFNGWSPTAWPMALTANEWTLERELPVGTHQYKFVLDGRDWVRDERNPMSAPDGFGGQNSVVVVQCAPPVTPTPPTGRAPGFDPAAMLPVESRPHGFAFDTSVEGAVVTSVHVSEHLRAARALTDALGAATLREAVGCAGVTDAAACADRVARAFGRRVFRRPLTDAEAQRYRALVTGAPSLDAGLARAVRAMLVSPTFLYRSEMGAPQGDGTWRLTPWELASALSYTFWGTTPDDALLDAAERGALSTTADLEREARRLLASPRAREQVAVFGLQWLGVEPVATAPRSAMLYPDFSDAVRASMLEEVQRGVVHAVFEGSHRLEQLYTARESFLDETLARFYGVSGVTGGDFRRVAVPEARAAGLLGWGAVLARYAHSDQSSPIQRGVFVRQALLCQSFPPPPPNAGGVPDVDPRATTRERFRQHSSDAACASCHQHIDALGFGFEHFDAVGRVRATENGMPVDHAGALTDAEGFGAGTSARFDDLPALGRAMAASPAAEQCLARQWYRFARGYREAAPQRCAVRAMTRHLRDRGGDLRELLVSVALSPDFALRR